MSPTLVTRTLDVRDGADVVFGGEHELVVEHPLGLVVEAGGGVQLDHLVVLARQVVARPLQVRHLAPATDTQTGGEASRRRHRRRSLGIYKLDTSRT